MNIFCSCRHTSSPVWRLRLLRSLLHPESLRTVPLLHNLDKPSTICRSRNFSRTSERARNNGAARKRKKVPDPSQDAVAFLEQAAQRVTHGGVTPPSLAPTPRGGGTSPRKALRSEKVRPRAKLKTPKEIEQEESMAFLDQAAQRVTTNAALASHQPGTAQRVDDTERSLPTSHYNSQTISKPRISGHGARRWHYEGSETASRPGTTKISHTGQTQLTLPLNGQERLDPDMVPDHAQKEHFRRELRRSGGPSQPSYVTRKNVGLPRLDAPLPQTFNVPDELDTHERLLYKEAMEHLMGFGTRSKGGHPASADSDASLQMKRDLPSTMPKTPLDESLPSGRVPTLPSAPNITRYLVSRPERPSNSKPAPIDTPGAERITLQSPLHTVGPDMYRREQSPKPEPSPINRPRVEKMERGFVDDPTTIFNRSPKSFRKTSRSNSDGGLLSKMTPKRLYSTARSYKSPDPWASGDAMEIWGSETVRDQPRISPFEQFRARRREPKKRVETEDRLRLAHNPWAQLLASPIRRCQVSAVRVPNKLLTAWSLVRNPADNHVYLTPVDLADLQQLSATSQSAIVSEGVAIEDVKHSMRPPKVYIRPSSNIISKLNLDLQILPRGRNPKQSGPSTKPGSVTRLLTQRMKEQARRYKFSSKAGDKSSNHVTESELKAIQWHPDTQQIMQNLMSLRISKALVNFVKRCSQADGAVGQVIRLPSAGLYEATVALKVNPNVIRQAILIWLGPDVAAEKGKADAGQQVASKSRDQVNPSKSDQFTLQLQTLLSSKNAHREIEGHGVFNKILAVWRRNPHPSHQQGTMLNVKPTQGAYIPPCTTLELGALEAEPKSNLEAVPLPSSNLNLKIPIFDLPALLGPTHLQKTLANPAVKDQLRPLSADSGSEPSGWALITGAGGAGETEEEYKSLVQEIWRLWLFCGGRKQGDVLAGS